MIRSFAVALCLWAVTATAAHADPPRALLLGDSNMQGWLGRELERSLHTLGYDVHRYAKVGTGLARPDYFDWLRIAPRLIDRVQPAIVIMIVGGNDVKALTFPGKRGKRPKGISWRSQRWRDEYRGRVRRLAQALLGKDRRLFLLSPTNRRPRKAREGVKRVREVQRTALSDVPRATWIDAYQLTSESNGRFLARGRGVRGRRVAFRKRDGIHLTRAGAKHLHAQLLPILLERGLDGDPLP